MTVPPRRLRTARVLACMLALAAFPSLASGAMSDHSAAKLVAWARHDFEGGRYDVAADRLEHVLKKRPDYADAAVLLCLVRATIADAWEMVPEDNRVILGRFEDAARDCSRASSVNAAPKDRVSVRRDWARAVDISEDAGNAVAAYRAWSEAAPDDPRAIGGLAAWLEKRGKPAEADAILAHALGTSEAFVHRVRFEYACRTADPERRDRLEPILDTMRRHEQTAEGKAMIGVLETTIRTGDNGGGLAFLDAIAAKRIDDANAHYLWNCMGGERRFALGHEPSDPPPGWTFPKRKAWCAPVYPEKMRAAGRVGKALVLTRIDTDGTVSEAWVAQATAPEFGTSAADALRRSTFVPGTADGRPIAIFGLYHIRFTID